MISPTTIWVYSPLVDDAKTEEMQHQEMRDAVVRLQSGKAGGPFEPPHWPAQLVAGHRIADPIALLPEGVGREPGTGPGWRYVAERRPA